MSSKKKSVVLFLEDDNSFECHILSSKISILQLDKYLDNNLLIGSKITSLNINNNKYESLNRDITYLQNILQLIINKYGNIEYILKNVLDLRLYREDELNKLYNGRSIPKLYKLFELNNIYRNKYYIKSTNNSTMLSIILSICSLYDISFNINISIHNYYYKYVKLSFEDI